MPVNEQLIKRAQKGHLASQRSLYEYCHALLMPIGMRYKVNEQDAVSVVNWSYIKILDKYSDAVGGQRFDSWCRRIMTNRLIDEYRQSKKNQTVSTDDEKFYATQDNWTSKDSDCISNLNYQEIIKAVGQLSEPSRTIFNLYVIEGYSHDEISGKMGISSVNCRYHLSQAKKKLRRHINTSLLI